MTAPRRRAPARRAARSQPAAAPTGPWIPEFDLHLFGEGTHQFLYRRMGAQVIEHGGVGGVNFAVWAPHATHVSVIGSFNGWDATQHPMQRRGATGVWERFIAGVGPGALYKFEIGIASGHAVRKADPYGSFSELRPDTASVVHDLDRYKWRDSKWMAARAARQAHDQPISIYEVHAASWKRTGGDAPDWLSWRELAEELVPYAKRMGFTHLELMPVTEHPLDASWGYQTVGYFAPTARHGTPDDFRYFIDTAHRAGLGVILDWVPAHFPKDAHGLARFDGTHLYEHADPRRGEHKDWGTLVFNLSRPQVSGFLLASALHWLDRYHIDGLRVDAVASMLYLDYGRESGEWVPNARGGRENLEAVEFLQRLNTVVHERFPGVLTFAEESTSWPRVTGAVARGGLGFDYKWNMGWMNDTLSYFSADAQERAFKPQKLTFSLHYAWSERFLLPLSHDEVVHGKRSLLFKMPGDAWKKFAQLRALYAWMVAHPGKKLLFMGGEIGQIGEWNCDRQVTWPLLDEPMHAQLQTYVGELQRLYRSTPPLHQIDDHWDGFQWIELSDPTRSVFAFARRSRDPAAQTVVVAHFGLEPREAFRLRLPAGGRWTECLNTDDTRWGGSGVVNAGGVEAVAIAEQRDGLTHQATLRLPPLGVSWFVPEVRAPKKRRRSSTPPPPDTDPTKPASP